MIPYYDEGGITIYHGDCREVLADQSASLLLTDPPYNLGLDYGPDYNDLLPPQDYADLIERRKSRKNASFEYPRTPKGRRMSAHRHANPSPSHCIAAWCNGTAADPGCGGPVPLYAFKDRRQDEPPHESYFIDRRDPPAVLKAVEDLLHRDGPHWPAPHTAWVDKLRALASEVAR